MKASAVVLKNKGIGFGELVFSAFTLMMINAIVIVPAGLILQDFLRSIAL